MFRLILSFYQNYVIQYLLVQTLINFRGIAQLHLNILNAKQWEHLKMLI